jgi:hypothetical protein
LDQDEAKPIEGVPMRERPIWALSAWGGFICMLFALSSLMRGAITASLLMVFGAAVLCGWALWLAHHRE